MNNKPFIHLLKTPLGKYFFDVNTNSIVSVSDEIYSYLENKSSELSREAADEIESLKKSGYLSSHRVAEIKHPMTDNIEDYLSRKCNKLLLQVTQNCNFRCSYCPYTTSEFYANRTHSSKRMSADVAIRAIDFFAEHSVNTRIITIGFYGGEPLLEFDLLKKLVEYANDLFIGKRICYTITTNASLLNEEIMAFLAENNVDLTISIDGTKKAHDRNRKFASNGKGTFDVIEKNLKEFYKNHKDYFIKKVCINSVMDPRYPAKEYFDLETSDEMYSAIRLRRTIVEDEYTASKHAFDDKFIYDSNVETFHALMAMIKRYPKEKVNKGVLDNHIADKEVSERYLKSIKQLPDVAAPSGACIPGSKLFCDVNGVLHICEKASETSKAFILGNIYDGFDYENIKKMLNIGALTPEKCRNCFAFSLCNICQKDCNINDELSAEKKRSACRRSRGEALGKIYTKLFYEQLKDILDKELVL